jgi:Ca2+:H+ antiporter
LLVAPLLVLLGVGSVARMDLVFRPIELVIVAPIVALFAYIVRDGQTNWLEGFELLAIDTMAAVILYVVAHP